MKIPRNPFSEQLKANGGGKVFYIVYEREPLGPIRVRVESTPTSNIDWVLETYEWDGTHSGSLPRMYTK